MLRRFLVRMALPLLGVVISVALEAQPVPVLIQKRIAPTYSPLSTATLAALNASNAEDYGPLVVASVPQAEVATFTDRARALGLAGRAVPEFAEIRLRDFSVAGLAAAADTLSPDLRISDYPSAGGARGLYVVQFRSLLPGALNA